MTLSHIIRCSAVDTVLCKLKKFETKFLRLGRSARVRDELQVIWVTSVHFSDHVDQDDYTNYASNLKIELSLKKMCPPPSSFFLYINIRSLQLIVCAVTSRAVMSCHNCIKATTLLPPPAWQPTMLLLLTGQFKQINFFTAS